MTEANKIRVNEHKSLENSEKLNVEKSLGGQKEKSPDHIFETPQPAETEPSLTEKSKDGAPSSAPKGGGLADISNLQKAKRVRMKEIEKVMEENLQEIYLGLAPDKQIRFKAAGEVTSAKISDMIEKGTVTLKKIIDLIKKWLSNVPGINKYFLEQEAKIKADKIMEIKNNE